MHEEVCRARGDHRVVVLTHAHRKACRRLGGERQICTLFRQVRIVEPDFRLAVLVLAPERAVLPHVRHVGGGCRRFGVADDLRGGVDDQRRRFGVARAEGRWEGHRDRRAVVVREGHVLLE